MQHQLLRAWLSLAATSTVFESVMACHACYSEDCSFIPSCWLTIVHVSMRLEQAAMITDQHSYVLRAPHPTAGLQGMCCFSLLADVAYCPLCQQSIIPTTCAFVGCAWMYDGRKLEPDNSVTCCSSEWEVSRSENLLVDVVWIESGPYSQRELMKKAPSHAADG